MITLRDSNGMDRQIGKKKFPKGINNLKLKKFQSTVINIVFNGRDV